MLRLPLADWMRNGKGVMVGEGGEMFRAATPSKDSQGEWPSSYIYCQ